MKNRSLITKLSFGILVVSFIAYTQFFAQAEKKELNLERKSGRMSSISMADGRYRIDTAIIWSDRNKHALLDDLEMQSLADKTTKNQIPGFIIAFLDSMSPGKKFNMADPGAEWWQGDIQDMVFKTIYNKEKQDTLCVLSGNKKGLPDKQLVYFGIGKNIALLSYYTAGATLSQCTVLIKFKDKTIIDLWFQNALSLSPTKSKILRSIARNGNC